MTRVPDTASMAGYFIYEMAEVEEKASRELLRDRRRLAGPAAHVKLAFVEGRAARRLREAANHAHAGLLIVGSRRHGALRSFVAGSVSADLAADSRVPVMIVPRKVQANARPPEHVTSECERDETEPCARLALARPPSPYGALSVSSAWLRDGARTVSRASSSRPGGRRPATA